ncbi:LppP/LprE family lipoprotein [Rhodococcus sp. 3Y1]
MERPRKSRRYRPASTRCRPQPRFLALSGRSWETNFDPCAELSYAIAETNGGTGSSPQHVMLFHRGEYQGTATACSFGFTSVIDSSSDSVTVQYKWPRGMDSNANPSGLATATFVWDGDGVVMQNDLPAELLKVSGCK